MTLRTRTIDKPLPYGWAERIVAPTSIQYNSSSFIQSRDRCTDEVIVGNGGTLMVEHRTLSGGIRNGLSSNGKWSFSNFINQSASSVFWDHHAFSTPTNSAYAAKLLALTNPSRPVVDLPVFVAELKDFPRLFKLAGNNHWKKIASANLSYQFGWKPLASDLMAMANFADIVSQRRQELEHFYASGLSRTRKLDTMSVSALDVNRIFDSDASLDKQWRGVHSKDTVVEVSGHVKWYPTTLPPKSDKAMINLARRAAFGLTIDAKTAWELIPFSWLIDWCSSTGDYLLASRNIIPANHSTPLIMRHTKTSNTVRNTTYDTGATPSPLKCDVESKSRVSASASLNAHLPFLSARQLSILGSIAVLRR